MKFFQFYAFLLAVTAGEAFLTNPFLGDNAVKSFLDEISVKRPDTVDLMTQAIPGEFCNRECTGDKKICHFKFMIKFYQVMSG